MPNDWTTSETISAPDIITINWKVKPAGATEVVDKSVDLKSTTKSNSKTEYQTFYYNDAEGKLQAQDVAVFKRDVKTATIASVNSAYVTYRVQNGLGLPYGNAENVSETTTEYAITTEGPVKIRDTTVEQISYVQFVGSLAVPSYEGYSPGTELIVANKTVVEYENVKTSTGREMTRTKTSRWLARGLSQEGTVTAAADLKEDDGKFGTDLNPIVFDNTIKSFLPLVFEGTEVQTSTGREPVPARPSQEDLIKDEVVNGDTNSDDTTTTPEDRYGNAGWTAYIPEGIDWRTLDRDSDGDGVPDWAPYVPGNWEDFSTADTDYTTDAITFDYTKIISGVVRFDGSIYNSTEDTVTAAYEMPFAPDDYFQILQGQRRLTRGGARVAAEAFGRMESALDIGHAYGQNIVAGFNEIPSDDLSPLYLQIAGIEGAFLCDSVSYAWGPEGMVVSSDLMLLGVTGYYGSSAPATSWLRLPVASTGLTAAGATTVEANPVKANSIAIPNGFSAATPGPTLAMLPSNGSDVFAEWRQGSSIIGPTLAVEAFTVWTGPYLRSRTYEYALTLEAETAEIASGPIAELEQFSSAQLPETVITLGALAPVVVTDNSVIVPVGVTAISIDALAPAVKIGASVAVPIGEITLTAQVPTVRIGASDPNFSSVSLLLHMDGSNGSTTFTDSSSSALTVTAYGNAQISTAQSKFGGASGAFDGSGDYLQISDTEALELGNSNWTIECWVKTSSSVQYATILSRMNGSFTNGSVSLLINNASATTGDVAIWIQNYGFTGPLMASSGVNVRDNSWHHIAVVRNGSAHALYVDGVSRATATASYTIANITTAWSIGSDLQYPERALACYIDDLRITKGVARPNVVPTAPFPDS